MVVAGFFVGGLAFGTLANLVIQRDRTRAPLFRGRLACPECAEPAPLYRRLPLLSWAAGAGRRRCGCRISGQEPVVELVMGTGWALIVAKLGIVWILPAFLAMTWTLVTVSAIDLAERRIPNKILGPMAVLAAVLLTFGAVMTGRPQVLARMAAGSVAYAAPMMGMGMLIPGSMGMGDVKLAAYLGLHLAWFGYADIFVGAFFGFLAGGMVGLSLVALRKKGRKDTLPFGPSMAVGAFMVLMFGASIPYIWP